ncbi:MAPEG family protein [Thalassotalea sp. PLHSN55]|uniref:MAPEG family protein n=1 Tax=Thalassotalea sp. PLHSN55 TaxID=3435888 RepID=UPI003F873B30
MSVLIWCLFIACLLPFLAKIPVAIAMNKEGGYDNNHPRAQQEKLHGFGARALAAHQNAFESLIIFAPAILIAIFTHNTGSTIQTLAMTYVVARVLYNLLYLANIAWLRSLVWAFGLGASLAIIYLSLPV